MQLPDGLFRYGEWRQDPARQRYRPRAHACDDMRSGWIAGLSSIMKSLISFFSGLEFKILLVVYRTRGTPPCETSFPTGLLSDVCCTALGERGRLTPCPCLTATRNFGVRPPAPRTACTGPLPLAGHVWARCRALRCSLLSALRATLESVGWVRTPRF